MPKAKGQRNIRKKNERSWHLESLVTKTESVMGNKFKLATWNLCLELANKKEFNVQSNECIAGNGYMLTLQS